MKFILSVNKDFIIPKSRFNNIKWISIRLKKCAQEDRGSLKTTLEYLYVDNGPINLPRNRFIIAKKYLDPIEKIVTQWKFTRTNGSERKNYGPKAGIEARNARYRCRKCGISDVRVLELDHIGGRKNPSNNFMCLCSNCHSIKTWKSRQV